VNTPPSVGRIVHYVSHGTPIRPDGTQEYPSACRSAIITEVDVALDEVGLCVFNPTGLFFHPLEPEGCLYDETATEGGSWHWPERV
jgi:hypothetical protein